MNLILVGLPGVGKTTIGRAVAKELHRPFIDFDTEIEHREHATVTEIFATKGEGYFRSLEESLTRELATTRNSIMSTGGGWVTNPICTELLRPTGRMIYLRAAPSTVLARMAGGRARRPLFEGTDGITKMMSLYEFRHPLYETADLTIDTEVIVKSEVIAKLRDYAQSLNEKA
ncbi:MAG TPA: shikimate kinase [Gemmatimonadaceae bacterium]|nr:shikimate kinase [Gemmatimonadaceae bacterium]